METVERTEIDNDETESQEVQSSSIYEPHNPTVWNIWQSSSIYKPLNPKYETFYRLPAATNHSIQLYETFYKIECKTEEKERQVSGELCKTTKLVQDLDRLNLEKCKHYLCPWSLLYKY